MKQFLFLLCLPLLAQTGPSTPGNSGLPSLFGDHVKLGGWYDMLASKAGTADPDLDVPHLFLFMDANLGHSWRAFVEVGYRKAPAFHENDKGDTTLERAYLEYRYGIPLKLRAGKLTTPAGLWKQLQWSIMVDTNRKPLIEEMMYIPNQLTGVAALGQKMVGDFELGYEVFAARDEGHQFMDGKGARTNTGIDLNLSFAGNKVGAFYDQFRNNTEGADTLPGDRRVTLLYADISPIPNRLSWRSEWLSMRRSDVQDIEGYYTRLKWQWRRDIFTNYRYDNSEEPIGLTTLHHKAHTVTLGYRPLSWLRTRAEYARHHVERDVPDRFNEFSVWMGLLF